MLAQHFLEMFYCFVLFALKNTRNNLLIHSKNKLVRKDWKKQLKSIEREMIDVNRLSSR